jgi:DNA-binding MarR family transcriptional regulator
MSKRLGGTGLDLSGAGYCVAFNSRKAARAVTKLYDLELAPSGIRSTQFAVLITLARSQPVSIGGLAEAMLIDTTTLTRSLRLMRKQGLLTISERSTMRQRFVTLTREGTRVLEKSLPQWRRVQTRFVNAIGKEHWKVLQQELARLSTIARKLETSRPPKSDRVAHIREGTRAAKRSGHVIVSTFGP